ncbi:hypothetical protein [Microbacterium sp. YY-01]|uniref:hypothetical protein n=1 Tax=Microbacterium sp. YY-01 TaxID=3421634 RepID=UPI003D170FDC
MAQFKINDGINAVFSTTVEAVKFRHEGDYFIFYGEGEVKTYAVASAHVVTVEKVAESK